MSGSVLQLSGDFLFTTDLQESSSDSTNMTTSCEMYDSTMFKLVAVVRAGVGLSSLVFSLLVIFVIFCYKRYTIFTQRLVLYLAIAVLLHSLSYIVSRVNFSDQRKITDPYCLFAGFFEFYAGWVELLVICLITFNLFLVAVCGEDTSKWERFMLPFLFLGPFLWCSLPYIQLTYGTNGPWCGIRVFNDDCSRHNLGNYFRFFLWHFPLYFVFLTLYIIALVLVAIKLKKDAKEWEGARYDPKASKQKKKLIREFKFLIWYPIIFMVFEIPLLVSHIYEPAVPHKPNVVLWMLEAITPPLAGTAIAIVYCFDKQTRQLFRKTEIKNMCLSPCLLVKNVCLSPCSMLCTKKEPTVSPYDVVFYPRHGDSLEGERARRTLYEQRRIAAITHAEELVCV